MVHPALKPGTPWVPHQEYLSLCLQLYEKSNSEFIRCAHLLCRKLPCGRNALPPLKELSSVHLRREA